MNSQHRTPAVAHAAAHAATHAAASAAEAVHHRLPFLRVPGGAPTRPVAWNADDRRNAAPGRTAFEDDALPCNDFLRQLHIEKRRSERSGAALSLVLYRLDRRADPRAPEADRLLEMLHGAKRETDVLGHVGADMLAILCPDTHAQGMERFKQKVADLAGDLPLQTVSGTYPDHLFERLGQGSATHEWLEPLLVRDRQPHVKAGAGTGYGLKRTLDIVGALAALLLLAPLMAVVALLVAATSRGPVIFRQTRLGKGGLPFTFYKFRSMVVNGDDRIHRQFVAQLIEGQKEGRSEYQTGGAAPAAPTPAAKAPPPAPTDPAHEAARRDSAATLYKLKADPRVTALGRVIRLTSIDELPQLFNVLKGDMSLVGPRPPIPYEAEHYQSWHLRRILTVKPGITGLWQIEGRSRVTFNEMVRMDLRYIRECSLRLDLRILLKTFSVVVRCDGAA